MTLSTTVALFAIASLLSAPEVAAYRNCYYDRYGRYQCSGLSTGARIAIGVCVGVGVFLIFALLGCFKRKQIKNSMSNYRPPPPATMQSTSENPYANNPPPPTGTYGAFSGSGFNGSSGPTPPANTYQPSGQHGLASGYYGTDKNTTDNTNSNLADHGYEYEQAQANAAAGGGPPGYDVAATSTGPYSPPTHPPPTHGNTDYAPPAGPPPGKY